MKRASGESLCRQRRSRGRRRTKARQGYRASKRHITRRPRQHGSSYMRAGFDWRSSYPHECEGHEEATMGTSGDRPEPKVLRSRENTLLLLEGA